MKKINTNFIIIGDTMENLKDLLQTLVDYILNNRLNIDKETFFMIVIGQITIYGILLTFYQFVASYQGSEKDATKYLGINITEYFVKKNISVFDKILSRKLFGGIFVLEIMYKPIVAVYGDVFSMQVISVMDFAWYMFVISYFVLFVILFFQCTKSILMIRLCSDAKTNESLVGDINRKFLKRTVQERITQKAVALLNKDFMCLRDAIKCDDNPSLQMRYDSLIYIILNTYAKQKAKEISQIEKKKGILKNRVSWIHTANCEIHLLREMIDGKYFSLDRNNMKLIFSFHMELLNINLKRVELEGYQGVSCDKHNCLGRKKFDTSEWKNVTLEIYHNADDEMKEDMVRFLQLGARQNQNLYKRYCNECIFKLIESEIGSIFEGERQQKEFVKIFSQIIKEEYVNNFCSNIIRDKIISYDTFYAGEIINQLSESNCTYLFSYIIMYYSIYRFRVEWKYVNISLLETLWNRHSSMKEDAEAIIERIKKSNIGHRFVREMYIKFVEYIEASVDGELLNKVNDDKMLDTFYIWVMKMCVVNQKDSMYSIYKDDYGVDIQVTIINELSKHDELLENKNILSWINYVKYNKFKKLDHFPENLNISLRSLLLTDVKSKVVADYVSEQDYYYIHCFGEYLLIKLQDFSVVAQEQKVIKEAVKYAFIARNMDADEYVDMLEKECDICMCKINYVQKEKMKEYLLKII